MAKAPLRKPKKKVCVFCKDKVDLRRLQGHDAAAQVHLRPRQDPRASRDRQLQPAPARRRHRRSRTAARWRCCPTPAPARVGDATMKLILTQEVDRPRRPRRHRRGQGRLRPQLPRSAGPRDPGHPGRGEAGRCRSAGPVRSGRSATSVRRRRSPASSAPRRQADQPCGQGGRLFGSVTASDVADAVTAGGRPEARQAPGGVALADQVARQPHRLGTPAPRSCGPADGAHRFCIVCQLSSWPDPVRRVGPRCSSTQVFPETGHRPHGDDHRDVTYRRQNACERPENAGGRQFGDHFVPPPALNTRPRWLNSLRRTSLQAVVAGCPSTAGHAETSRSRRPHPHDPWGTAHRSHRPHGALPTGFPQSCDHEGGRPPTTSTAFLVAPACYSCWCTTHPDQVSSRVHSCRGPRGRVPALSVTALSAPEQEFDRVPPHDLAAEQGVLGGMLLSKDAIADVVEILHSHDFYRPAHSDRLRGRAGPLRPRRAGRRRQRLGRAGPAGPARARSAARPTCTR